MKKIIMISASIFLLGIILTIIFSVLPIFSVDEDTMFWGLKASFILMGASAVIIIILLVLERIRDNKKFKKEIKEKDLRPW